MVCVDPRLCMSCSEPNNKGLIIFHAIHVTILLFFSSLPLKMRESSWRDTGFGFIFFSLTRRTWNRSKYSLFYPDLSYIFIKQHHVKINTTSTVRSSSMHSASVKSWTRVNTYKFNWRHPPIALYDIIGGVNWFEWNVVITRKTLADAQIAFFPSLKCPKSYVDGFFHVVNPRKTNAASQANHETGSSSTWCQGLGRPSPSFWKLNPCSLSQWRIQLSEFNFVGFYPLPYYKSYLVVNRQPLLVVPLEAVCTVKMIRRNLIIFLFNISSKCAQLLRGTLLRFFFK